jgi:hypothetical protein
LLPFSSLTIHNLFIAIERRYELMRVVHRKFKEREVIAVLESDDPTILTDAGFFMHLRNALTREGYPTVRADMAHEGYIEPDGKLYLRDEGGGWYISDPRYVARPTHVAYEDAGYLCLELTALSPEASLPTLSETYKLTYPNGVELCEE